MKDLDKHIISVQSPEGDWMTVEAPWDASCQDMAHAFRAILFWLTFCPDDVIPDPEREWAYLDELKEDKDETCDTQTEKE